MTVVYARDLRAGDVIQERGRSVVVERVLWTERGHVLAQGSAGERRSYPWLTVVRIA